MKAKLAPGNVIPSPFRSALLPRFKLRHVTLSGSGPDASMRQHRQGSASLHVIMPPLAFLSRWERRAPYKPPSPG